MRKLSGTQLASLVAVGAAGLIVLFLEPLPPLLDFVTSRGWTRLIEWFVLSAALLALLSWMRLTDMEFELTSTGIKARRIQADPETVGALKLLLEESQKDNNRLLELARRLREENSLLSERTSNTANAQIDEASDA